jgi:hypothetical protein
MLGRLNNDGVQDPYYENGVVQLCGRDSTVLVLCLRWTKRMRLSTVYSISNIELTYVSGNLSNPTRKNYIRERPISSEIETPRSRRSNARRASIPVKMG